MLTFDHVNFSYPCGRAVLTDLSFHIQKGERVGLIGANGAGKSTLMRAALGLIVPQSGKITVSGQILTRETLRYVRKALGYVVQDSDNQLFMPTLREDLLFGPVNAGLSLSEAEKKVDAVLDELGIAHLKDRRSHALSGGEKKMAAIAGVLVTEPEALLMDEPSASLDPRKRRALIALLNRLPMGKNIATHDMDLVEKTCDRVILIDRGQVAADGDTGILRQEELLLAHGL